MPGVCFLKPLGHHEDCESWHQVDKPALSLHKLAGSFPYLPLCHQTKGFHDAQVLAEKLGYAINEGSLWPTFSPPRKYASHECKVEYICDSSQAHRALLQPLLKFMRN